MKKQEKLDVIEQAIHETEICRCYFSYDENYFYYYPNAVNEKFLLGQNEDDFLLDGYTVRKISQLKKVEIRDDKCNEINRLNGVTSQIKMPDVDITSWQTLFNSLFKLNKTLMIEDAIEEKIALGIIKRVFKNKIYFHEFDANGKWYDSETVIPCSKITSVTWDSRYTTAWEEYLKTQK